MAGKLFDLFDETLKSGRDLVPSAPLTLGDLSSSMGDLSLVEKKIDIDNQVVPKVDYSDFSKFVFFNSALDYFNISGERIINDYPNDGTWNDHFAFVSESDGYQKYLLSVWPRLTATTSFGEFQVVKDLADPALASFILAQQTTAAQHDRNNSSIITQLVPASFLQLEDDQQTKILRHLLYLVARQFDEIKLKIDQFVYVLRANYTDFDQVPDSLLADALSFWGWNPKGNFLSADAFQYMFGLGVSGSAGERLEMDLRQIKNEFWRRTLTNLPYIYKTKGTRESVLSLLRVYGLDERSVRLKEFGMQPDAAIQTHRINADRSAWALVLNTGTFSSASVAFSSEAATTLEANFRVPTLSGTDEMELPATGVLLHTAQENITEELWLEAPAVGNSGTVRWIRSSGSTPEESVAVLDVPIFDAGWYHVSVQRTGSWAKVSIGHLDEGRVEWTKSATGTIENLYSPGTIELGAGGKLQPSVGWVNNLRFWDTLLTEQELNDHILNPFSFGASTLARNSSLVLQNTFDRDLDTSVTGAFDSVSAAKRGEVTSGSYARFLFDYNFIAAPDYGWTEDKIRSFDVVEPAYDAKFAESNAVALEFNLVDALNEDISFMLSSLDNWNNLIGSPANRHRDSYPDLENLRRQYFSRLSGRVNFRIFADFLDFFDRSFVDLVRRLLPARVNFKGAEFVIESHMLERPKNQYVYRRPDVIMEPEGQISMIAARPSVPAAVTGSA